MNRTVILLSVCLLLARASPAEPRTRIHQGYVITEWATENGLLDNDIQSLCQDRDGFLWIGTHRGLMRFDGEEFKPWPLMPGRESLKRSVWSLLARPEGGLVVTGDEPGRGVFLLSDNLRPAPVQRLPETPSLLFRAVFRGRDRTIWAARWDSAWMRIGDGKVEFLSDMGREVNAWPCSLAVTSDGRTFLSRGRGLEEWSPGTGIREVQGPPRQPVTLCAAAGGGVWVATSTRLYRWRDEKVEEVAAVEGAAEDPPPYTMLETRDGAVWLATKSAGLRCWKSTRSFSVATPHPVVRCMIEDAEGNLWVGTAGGGLCQLRKTSFDVAGANVADTIGSFCQDASGKRWLANSNGIWHLNGKWAVPAFMSANAPREAQAVCPDRNGNVWIGTSGGIYRCRADDPEKLESMPAGPEATGATLALFCDSRGNIWAGSVSGPVVRFDRNGCEAFGAGRGFDGTYAQAFGEDSSGRIWLGTRKGGLYRLEDGRFRKLDPGLSQPLVGVLSILGDAAGNVWIGTLGQGLLIHRRERFVLLGEQHGLPDTTLSQILEDDLDRLWFGTSRTIFSVARSDLLACAAGTIPRIQALTYGGSDGIPVFYATGQRQPCAWITQDGRLNFLGRKGVVVHETSLEKPVDTPPRIFIDGVWLDEHETAASPSLRVPAGAQSVRIHFTAPSFAHSADIRFRYRLKGIASDWTENTSQRFALFTRPPPGDYRFEVTATNPRHGWEVKPVSLEITVLPFWWQRTPVRLTAGLAAALALGFTVRARAHRRLLARMKAVEQENRLEQERTRIARDLHDGLGAGLTEAGLLAAEMRQDAAGGAEILHQPRRLGERINALARELDAAVWAVSPRHDNLRSLCGYLCDYALEHFRHSPIRCLLEVEDPPPDLPVEPHVRHQIFMAVKESLNNVLKHSGATEVRLGIRMAGATLLVRISDNGVSFDPARMADSPRSGLRNMRERMEEVGGSFTIEAWPAKGTVVCMSLPLG